MISMGWKVGLASGVCALALAGQAVAQDKAPFNIPAGDLKAALETYTRQSPQPLVYRIDDVRGRSGKSVSGVLTPRGALEALLSDSNLRVTQTRSGALAVVRASSSAPMTARPVAFTRPASRQDEAPVAAPAPAQMDEPSVVGEIVVTGSRIARTDLTASSPLSVVTAEDLQATGAISIENVMNSFPQLAGGKNSSVNSGNTSGVLGANLRSLGQTRTLVLVNGRRFLPADGEGTVDLGSIPDALVERVDVVTGGASAVYGSDAIAGAVNFMLKRNFEGLEASYTHGRTDRDDGLSHKYDVTMGANAENGRGNAVLSVSHSRRDSIPLSARSYSETPLATVNGELVPGGGGNIPGGRIGLGLSARNKLVGVNLTPPAGCSTVTGIRFAEGGEVKAYCNPQDAYFNTDQSYLLRPMERTQLSALARYEVTDNVEAYAEAFYVKSQNVLSLAPDAITLATPGAASNTLIIPRYAANPILGASVRDFLIANAATFDADGDGNAALQGVERRMSELGERASTYTRTALNLTGGLRGSFDINGAAWKWDSFYQHQEAREEIERTGTTSLARLAQSLDAVYGAGGKIVCADQSRGCVPTDVLGIDAIRPEAAAFLAPLRTAYNTFERTVAGGSISGDAFELPAGPLGIALGAEYRQDAYHYVPGPLDQAGEYASRSEVAIGGEFDLWEVFGEFRAPLLSDMKYVHDLSIEGAIRYSDYSTIGGVTTWKLGAEYAPVDWLRFRTAYNQAIRAPNIIEMYTANRLTTGSGVDPCSASRKPTPAQQALCVAQGIPQADLATFDGGGNPWAFSGGNRNLKAETSDTFTIGFVASPPWVSHLNLTVDYFQIEVSDAIMAVSASQALEDCFRNLDPNSITCRSIVRYPAGQIEYVNSALQNVGSINVSGVDAQVDYRMSLPDHLALPNQSANLKVQASASWLFERGIAVIPGQSAQDCSGYFGGGCTGGGVPGTPDFKLRLVTSYDSGPLSLRLQGNMIGDMDLYEGQTAPVTRIGRQWYADLSGTYQVTSNVKLIAGVENLLDRNPPIVGTALMGETNFDPSLYEPLGRRYFAGVRLRF